MANILEMDSEQDAIDMADILDNYYQNHVLVNEQVGAVAAGIWSAPRQPTKVEFDFWLVRDLRDAYPDHSTSITTLMDASRITYRVKPLRYEHDWTAEEFRYYYENGGEAPE